jgi:predicted CDP-diglyceride synthetase/phosphatidate cytidylyltransferase
MRARSYAQRIVFDLRLSSHLYSSFISPLFCLRVVPALCQLAAIPFVHEAFPSALHLVLAQVVDIMSFLKIEVVGEQIRVAFQVSTVEFSLVER